MDYFPWTAFYQQILDIISFSVDFVQEMCVSHIWTKKSKILEKSSIYSWNWRKIMTISTKNWPLRFSWVLITKNAIKRSEVLCELLKSQFSRFSHTQFLDFSNWESIDFEVVLPDLPAPKCVVDLQKQKCKNVPMYAPKWYGKHKTPFSYRSHSVLVFSKSVCNY